MAALIKKFYESLQRDGTFKAVAKVGRYARSVYRSRRDAKQWDQALEHDAIEDRFHFIYKENLWGSTESASGAGSTLSYTENLRKELPKLLTQFSIKKVFDAPCGDFNWMRHLLATIDIDYIGGDIVRPLIEAHNKQYKNRRVSFIHIDLTKDTFPQSDLMICRDCLFHLSYADTKSVLKNFVNSGIPYLLTSTHTDTGSFANRDIKTGGFRLVDFFSAPYNFSRSPLASIDDWVAPHPERQLCLWTRQQVSTALEKFG